MMNDKRTECGCKQSSGIQKQSGCTHSQPQDGTCSNSDTQWTAHTKPCPYCHEKTLVKAWQTRLTDNTQGYFLVHCMNETCDAYYMTKSERLFFEVDDER